MAHWPFRAALAALIATLLAPPTWSHGTMPSARPATMSTDVHPWGRQGDPAHARRTVRIDMDDRMRFVPDRLEVRRGETVRFVVRNRGKVLHEMVIGTEAALAEHARLMRQHPGMEHDEPYMAHVSPGRRGEIVWTFTEPGEYLYGCLVPGHWEAGMKGRIVVRP